MWVLDSKSCPSGRWKAGSYVEHIMLYPTPNHPLSIILRPHPCASSLNTVGWRWMARFGQSPHQWQAPDPFCNNRYLKVPLCSVFSHDSDGDDHGVCLANMARAHTRWRHIGFGRCASCRIFLAVITATIRRHQVSTCSVSISINQTRQHRFFTFHQEKGLELTFWPLITIGVWHIKLMRST